MAIPKLLTAGEAFEDLVFFGLERLPAAGEEVKTNTFHATIGGGAVITAVGAARLGVATSVTSGLSDAAVARLRRERVRVHNLKHKGEAHAVTAALSTSTDRTFVTFNGVNAVLEPRLLDALAAPTATHLHVAHCPTDIEAWTALVKRLRRRGLTVSWDFGWSAALATRPELPALIDALDFVFLNELEAPLYTGAPTLDDAYPALRAYNSAVIVKLGADGSRWLRSDGDVVMPASRVDAVDTTGAGDAFNAGFLAAWLRGSQPAVCLATGNVVGGASTRAAGGLDALPLAAKLPALLRPTAQRGAVPTPARRASAARPAGSATRRGTRRAAPTARRAS
ncbi:MAG: carbohydrate kinase family protein [Acidobacteriota bacterium]